MSKNEPGKGVGRGQGRQTERSKCKGPQARKPVNLCRPPALGQDREELARWRVPEKGQRALRQADFLPD